MVERTSFPEAHCVVPSVSITSSWPALELKPREKAPIIPTTIATTMATGTPIPRDDDNGSPGNFSVGILSNERATRNVPLCKRFPQPHSRIARRPARCFIRAWRLWNGYETIRRRQHWDAARGHACPDGSTAGLRHAGHIAGRTSATDREAATGQGQAAKGDVPD